MWDLDPHVWPPPVPADADCYAAMADYLAGKGKNVEAADNRKHVVELTPEDAHSWELLAEEYAAAGEPDMARAAKESAAKLPAATPR